MEANRAKNTRCGMGLQMPATDAPKHIPNIPRPSALPRFLSTGACTPRRTSTPAASRISGLSSSERKGLQGLELRSEGL